MGGGTATTADTLSADGTPPAGTTIDAGRPTPARRRASPSPRDTSGNAAGWLLGR
jgi:hypothetical protein